MVEERKHGMMRWLGQARLASLAGLYAFVLEIFFGAVHAAALAATATGAPRNPNSLIFQICTVNGLVSTQDAEGGKRTVPARNAASDFCPVCSSAAVSFFTFAAPPDLPHAPMALLGKVVPGNQALPALRFVRFSRIRAPPVV